MGRDDGLFKSWMRLCRDPRSTSDLLEKAAYWESINDPGSYEIRLAVSQHRATSSELLGKLIMIKHLPIQVAVAGHENLSEKTAGKILKSQIRELRRALAGNPKIPLYAMEKLAKDFKDVRVRLAKNPAIPSSIMKRIAGENDPYIRLSLARNPNLHTTFLEQLSRDRDVEVRLAVVKHRATPLPGLREMAGDPSAKVREAVFARAQDDFPTDVELFRALATGSSVLAQEAEAHLERLLAAEHNEQQNEQQVETES